MDCAPMSPMLLSVHPNTHSIITQSTHTSHHHSPLKSSVVRDVSDLRPSPMDCAPMSPRLFSVHPTHPHACSHTSYLQLCGVHKHTTHHSPFKISVVSDVSDLRPSQMYCAPSSSILLSVHSTHTITHYTTKQCDIHHLLLKSSVVSDMSDLKPSPMYCAPICPMLFTVHPINKQSTNNNVVHTSHHNITHYSNTVL